MAMNKDLENALIIFTDGSSLGNPGPGGWGTLMIYPKLDEVIELGGTKIKTTNNEMELTAIVSALSYAMNSEAPAYIYTDSQYAINGINKWMYGWEKNGWQTQNKESIKNKEIWQLLYDLVTNRPKNSLHLQHVRGHVGVPGNERVDDIARELAEGINVPLYRGTLSDYPIRNVLQIPSSEEQSSGAKKSSSKKAYSYLSLINKELERHDTWPECEARVRGKNAKYKKALSVEHEKEILKEWGVEK